MGSMPVGGAEPTLSRVLGSEVWVILGGEVER